MDQSTRSLDYTSGTWVRVKSIAGKFTHLHRSHSMHKRPLVAMQVHNGEYEVNTCYVDLSLSCIIAHYGISRWLRLIVFLCI